MGSGCHRAGSEFDWPRIGIVADRCCCEPIQSYRSGETGDDCHLSRMSPPQECLSFETHSDVLTSSPGGNRTSPGHSFLLTRDFGLVWWSQLLSQVADGVSKLALLWFVYSVTGSPLKTTIVGVLQTVPPILFGPFIGVLVDRFSKKSILIVTDLIRALLIGVVPCIIPAEQFTVESLYVLVFLYGIATAMFVPTLSSSIPFMVSRPQFTAANALLQSTTSIGIIMGPLVSGVGIALSGSQEVLCLNAVTYLASVACLLPIRLTSVSVYTECRSSRKARIG